MNKINLLFLSILLVGEGCASECMYVKVTDNDGKPISDATFTVSFTSGHIVLADGTPRYYETLTDTNGYAEVRFDCDSSDVHWSVKKDGYYTNGPHTEVFRIDEVIIPPAYYNIIMREHEKHVTATLWKKVNPQPMYAHYPVERRKVPKTNGRYGFDLAEYDWLPPHGKGKVADFYLVRAVGDIPDSGEYEFGRIEFDRDCGFYVGKQTGCKEFPATYQANLNASFLTNIVLKCIRHRTSRDWVEPLAVLGNDEYLVLRTRVVHDENGNIVSANYSRILGEFRANPSIYVTESIFNPRSNDTNLEFDPERNLYQGRVRRGRIP